jgi:hypothetical protein
MALNLNVLLAALCLASLNQLSEFTDKEHKFANSKQSGKETPAPCPEAELFAAVLSASATAEQTTHCLRLAHAKVAKIHAYLGALEKQSAVVVAAYLEQIGDISLCKQAIIWITQKLCKGLQTDVNLLASMQTVAEFAPLLEELKPLVTILNHIQTQPGNYMAHVFNTQIKPAFSQEVLQKQFLQAYQNFNLQHLLKDPERFGQTKHQLLLATLKLGAFLAAEGVFAQTTEQQLKHLASHSHKLFHMLKS